MPMTPYQVDQIFKQWQDHHMEVLRIESGSSKLPLEKALFSGSPSFSSSDVKNGSMY